SDPRILGIVSGLFFCFGLVPGLPTFPFFIIAAASGYMAFTKYKDKTNVKTEEETKKTEDEQQKKAVTQNKKRASREDVMALLSVEPIEIEIGYRLVPLLDAEQGGDLLERIAQIRKQTALDFGIVLPSIRVRDNLQLSPNVYNIKLKGIPVEVGEVYPEKFLAMNAGGDANITGLDGLKAVEPAFGLPSLWINERDKEFAETEGFTVVSPSAVVSTHLTEVIKKNAFNILTRADVQQLVDNVKKTAENLVEDLQKESSTAEVQIILQNLLKERVSIRDLHTILEAISTYSRISKNQDFITEQCRLALARSICRQNLADTGELLAITLAPEVESTIMEGISKDGQNLTLDPVFTTGLIDNLNSEIEKAISSTGNQPVILCSGPIRLAFRKLLERTFPQISILSYNEIATGINAKSVGVVRVKTKQVTGNG
ncbi:MAG: flagellar biosynthesis protein FlhA, partial [Candidatus Gastranaerophilaceae bacterium]